MRIAQYPGSFDPLTNGHLYMINEALADNDKVVLFITVNPVKKPLFTLEERAEMARRSLIDMPNVSVQVSQGTKRGRITYRKYTVREARAAGAQSMVRGVRNGTDMELEYALRQVNGDMEPDVHTTLKIPTRDLTEVSSSFVKGLIGAEFDQFDDWERWVRAKVPSPVFAKLFERFHGHQGQHYEAMMALGAQDDPFDKYDALLKAYNDPRRWYHTPVHLAIMQEEIEDACDFAENIAAVQIAKDYHDRVQFEPESELASARVMQADLAQLGVPAEKIAYVRELILPTDHRRKPMLRDAQLLQDADLAIFGRPEFGQYNRDIRREHADVPDEVFRPRRAGILQRFLDRSGGGQHIYNLEYFQDMYEAKAQENLAQEIRRLVS